MQDVQDKAVLLGYCQIELMTKTSQVMFSVEELNIGTVGCLLN
jgi:hypothetical protein